MILGAELPQCVERVTPLWLPRILSQRWKAAPWSPLHHGMALCPRCGVTGTRMSGGKGQTHGHQLGSQNQHTLLPPTEAEWRQEPGARPRYSLGGRCKNRWPPPARHYQQRFENILKPLSPHRDCGQEANVRIIQHRRKWSNELR